jgi:hypothetical protein
VSLHVLLEKIAETASTVTYKYDFYDMAFNDDRYGILEFNHLNETYKVVKEREHDEEHVLMSRALSAILREWKKGSFPDETDWAG